VVKNSLPEFDLTTKKTSDPQQSKVMNNLSGPIIVEEDATHFLVGIHYNDRHLARDIDGRAWNGLKVRWTWKKNRKNYENLTKTFKEIAERFEITDKNLTEENYELEVDSIEEQGDWGFFPETDNYSQIKQLQSIENKIDELLLKSKDPAWRKEEDTELQPDNKQKTKNKKREDAPQAQEIVASLSTDETFNELILRNEANQSPIQRLQNKLRDEIRSFKEYEDEEIHQIITKYCENTKKDPYKRGALNLKPLIWLAEALEFYGPNDYQAPGLNIYYMLHVFNSMRNALVKRDQYSEELRRILSVSCLALGKFIWTIIRIRSAQVEKEMIELRKTEEG
jgi:septum formation inhibitor MinC